MLNGTLLLHAIILLATIGVEAVESEVNFIATSSCIPYAQSPGIHQITAPGLKSFDVLCDSVSLDPGWLVIQQRINGKEDFYRNWANYSAGFGSLDGDFFLGLERIHRLTNAHRHELNIYMEKFDGQVENAHYDRFQVAGEEQNYKLTSVGNFTKSKVFDCLNWHFSENFSTYDRDNDHFKDTNCAEQRQSGWWFAYCGLCNLNGRYFDHEVQNVTGIFWTPRTSLKVVKMLMRPLDD